MTDASDPTIGSTGRRRRRAWTLLLAVTGVLVGATVAAVVTTGSDDRPSATATDRADQPSGRRSGGAPDEDADRAADATTTVTGPATTEAPVAEAVDVGPGLLLVWASGGLPGSLEEPLRALDQVTSATFVRGADVRLTRSTGASGTTVDQTAPGWYLPLDAFAVDPATYGSVLPGGDQVAAAVAEPGTAVLGETSAAVRRLGVGASVEVAGAAPLRVTAIVPDAAVGAAELIVSRATGATIGVETTRSALVRYQGDRSMLERAIAALLPPSTHLRFRSPDETTFLRQGDAVLPQALVKQRFGEFAVRPGRGSALEISPGWVEANIVEVTLPVLGSTRCHRSVAPLLVAALQELVDDGLTGLLDPASFGGCFVPRLIGPGLGLSRHTWGVAVDVNVAANPLGGQSTQDPRLVDVLRRWGLASGADWLRPDPMHFEYLTAPR